MKETNNSDGDRGSGRGRCRNRNSETDMGEAGESSDRNRYSDKGRHPHRHQVRQTCTQADRQRYRKGTVLAGRHPGSSSATHTAFSQTNGQACRQACRQAQSLTGTNTNRNTGRHTDKQPVQKIHTHRRYIWTSSIQTIQAGVEANTHKQRESGPQTGKHTDKHTGRQTDGHTYRQRHTPTNRHAYKHSYIQIHMQTVPGLNHRQANTEPGKKYIQTDRQAYIQPVTYIHTGTNKHTVGQRLRTRSQPDRQAGSQKCGMNTYIHTYIHTYITYIHIYIHTYIKTNM